MKDIIKDNVKNKDVINFFFEIGMLKRIKHEGWRLIGIENPESVAEHTLRAAQIGYVLAKMSNYKNPEEVCSIIVFHDISETRIGDHHKLAQKYVKTDEELVVKDQTKQLDEIGKDIYNLWRQAEYKNTEAGQLAKDADYLEQAITAKEYIEQGYEYAQDWINNVSKVLRTKKAKELLESIKKGDSNEWWQGLKKIEDISKDKYK